MSETAKVANGFAGDKLYQQRARQILPILVRQAWSRQPVRYELLAREIKMPNPRNLNYPLGCIGDALNILAKNWKDEIPHIQALVISKNTSLPGLGFDSFLKGRGYEKASSQMRRAIIIEYWTRIYEYPYWRDVLVELSVTQPSDSAAIDMIDAASTVSGGEGEDHRALKIFLSKNPILVGLKQEIRDGEVEYSLPSGDSVDIAFNISGHIHAVEVKPLNAPTADIARGLFQCVKYRAVLQARARHRSDDHKMSVCLALGGELPIELVSLRNSVNVEVFENLHVHLKG